ncbi:hypothetical protein, partial [Aggregatibacter actinomycetemcomitans]|uniref:hypothetical protein n=1 Tax=Aggregatibacter actinomycetemcomitans TaxID=714 RepID=UPI00197BCC64
MDNSGFVRTMLQPDSRIFQHQAEKRFYAPCCKRATSHWPCLPCCLIGRENNTVFNTVRIWHLLAFLWEKGV